MMPSIFSNSSAINRLSVPARFLSNSAASNSKSEVLERSLLRRLTGHRLPHHAKEHREEALLAVLHRFGEVVGRHVGVDHVALGVVDELELVFEAEHVLKAVLQHRHWVASRFGALGNTGPFGGHQLVEHDVILLELLIQVLIIGLLAHMYGADQINHYAGLRRIVGNEASNRGLQSRRFVVGVALETHVFRRRRGGGAGSSAAAKGPASKPHSAKRPPIERRDMTRVLV